MYLQLMILKHGFGLEVQVYASSGRTGEILDGRFEDTIRNLSSSAVPLTRSPAAPHRGSLDHSQQHARRPLQDPPALFRVAQWPRRGSEPGSELGLAEAEPAAGRGDVGRPNEPRLGQLPVGQQPRSVQIVGDGAGDVLVGHRIDPGPIGRADALLLNTPAGSSIDDICLDKPAGLSCPRRSIVL